MLGASRPMCFGPRATRGLPRDFGRSDAGFYDRGTADEYVERARQLGDGDALVPRPAKARWLAEGLVHPPAILLDSAPGQKQKS